MDTNKQKSNNIVAVHHAFPLRRFVLAGALIGAIFPIFAWIIDISAHQYEFELYTLWRIHRANPIHFLIDMIPAVIAALTYFVGLHGSTVNKKLEDKISYINKKIAINIELARTIGEKDFSVDIVDIPKDDELAKSLLAMRQNLAISYEKENERNWIARGKERIADILRHHNKIENLAFETLVELIKYTNMIQGSFYLFQDEQQKIVNLATYAYNRQKFVNQSFKVGQGLIGEAAFEMDIIYRKEIPEDYVSITSGLVGDRKPLSLLIVPLIGDEKLQGIIEISSLENDISELTIRFYEELSEIIGQTLFNLKVNSRTETLLNEAREMTQELQRNEDTLRRNAEEMRLTQLELQESNKNLESQIQKVENAQKRLHSLLENASEVISIYDEYGIVRYESPSVKSILGYAPEDIIGKNAFNVETIASNEISKTAFYELLDAPDEVKTFEYQYKKNTGELIWLESTARNLIDDPAIQGILFNTRDITVRKVAEKAERMSGQMAALSENSPDMIMRLSPQGSIYYANPVVKIYTGIQNQEVVNKNIDEVELDSQVAVFLKDTINRVRKTEEKYNDEINFPAKFGERIMQVNVIPEFNESKELESILFVANDVTDRKQIELEIEKKNKNITESINYAYRIQSAILPDTTVIRKALPQSFIFYKPRDVVSGDFPWFFKRDDNIYIAAVDATGHGVPGALLSVIGYFLLNNIVDHDHDIPASTILDQLHAGVRRTLKQDTDEAYGRDGMDIAFCKINLNKMELQFAGAHRPLYLYRGNELKVYKGNSKAIGGIPDSRRKEKEFINHQINIQKGDKLFIFSDGLPDQIGGEKGRKYQAVRIRNAIKSNPQYTMDQFSKYFSSDFIEWKGEDKQIDDVLLIGIEI